MEDKEEEEVNDFLLVTLDRKRRMSIHLSLTSQKTVADLKSEWSWNHKCDPDSFAILSPESEVMMDDASLGVFSKAGFVRLFVEEKQTLCFSLYKADNCKVSLEVLLSARPTSLYDTLREKFHIPSNRSIRLLDSQSTVLDENTTFRAFKVTSESVISVDPEVQINLINKSDKQKIHHAHLFSSDPSPKLLLNVPVQRFQPRLYFQGQRLHLSGDLATFLRQAKGMTERSPIEVDFAFSVALMSPAGTVCHEQARDADHVKDVIVSQGRQPTEVTLDGAVIATIKKCLAAALQPEGLLVSNSLKFVVQLSKRSLKTVRMPHKAVLRDLLERVSAMKDVASDEIELRSGGRVLSDPRLLLSSLSTDNIISIASKPFQLTVEIEDLNEDYTFVVPASKTSITRDDIVAFLFRKSVINRKEMKTMILKCVGCQRQLHHEMSAQQPIPSNCCGLASLNLKMKRRKGRGGQNCSRVREHDAMTCKENIENVEQNNVDSTLVGHDSKPSCQAPPEENPSSPSVLEPLRETETEMEKKLGGNESESEVGAVAKNDKIPEPDIEVNENRISSMGLRRRPQSKSFDDMKFVNHPNRSMTIGRSTCSSSKSCEEEKYVNRPNRSMTIGRGPQSKSLDETYVNHPKQVTPDSDDPPSLPPKLRSFRNKPLDEEQTKRTMTLDRGPAPPLQRRITNPNLQGTGPAPPLQRRNTNPNLQGDTASYGYIGNYSEKEDNNTYVRMISMPAGNDGHGGHSAEDVYVDMRDQTGASRTQLRKIAFCFRNKTKIENSKEFLNTKIKLPSPPTIGDLRRAFTEKYKIHPSTFYFTGLRATDAKGELYVGVKHPDGNSLDNWCANKYNRTRLWTDLFRKLPSQEILPDNAPIFELTEELSISLVIETVDR